jgi:hypothetical protein
MEEDILFTEQQRFNQVWVWVVLIIIDLSLLFGIYHQVVGERGLKHDWVAGGVLYFSSLLVFAVTIIIFFSKLETTITKEAISVRFFPLILKTKVYHRDSIEQAVVRNYSPLAEYGGWGFRFNSDGRAYNVSGDTGIQLVFKNGKKLLIGTNKGQEAANVLAVLQY